MLKLIAQDELTCAITEWAQELANNASPWDRRKMVASLGIGLDTYDQYKPYFYGDLSFMDVIYLVAACIRHHKQYEFGIMSTEPTRFFVKTGAGILIA